MSEVQPPLIAHQQSSLHYSKKLLVHHKKSEMMRFVSPSWYGRRLFAAIAQHNESFFNTLARPVPLWVVRVINETLTIFVKHAMPQHRFYRLPNLRNASVRSFCRAVFGCQKWHPSRIVFLIRTLSGANRRMYSG